MQAKEDKTRKWNILIAQYIAHHKYLQSVGKQWIMKEGRLANNSELRNQLSEALKQIDKSLLCLKDFFRPSLTDEESSDIFAEDRYKNQVDFLLKQNEELRTTCEALKEKNGDTDKQDFENLITENGKLKEQIRQLVEKNHQNLTIDNNSEIIYRKKQQEFSETLKIQNDLISDLKEQLMRYKRECELFKSLNKGLEIELQKKQVDNDIHLSDTLRSDAKGFFKIGERQSLKNQNDGIETQMLDLQLETEKLDEHGIDTDVFTKFHK